MSIYTVMVKFIADYFIIGFRIVLPMFAVMLIVNTILAILAKVATANEYVCNWNAA